MPRNWVAPCALFKILKKAQAVTFFRILRGAPAPPLCKVITAVRPAPCQAWHGLARSTPISIPTSTSNPTPTLGVKPSARADTFKKRHQNRVLPSGRMRCSLIRLQRVFSIRAGVAKMLRLLRISRVATNFRWLGQTLTPCSDLAFLVVASWPHMAQHQPSSSRVAVNRPLLHTLVHWRPLNGGCPTRAAHSSRPPRSVTAAETLRA